MAVYAIGDVQGCYSQLLRLLEEINFDTANDCLWFCGDLVNRGPESLQTLRFIRSLGDKAISVLGNHDLHLLALYHSGQRVDETDTLAQVLTSTDCDELMGWLQSRPIAHYDASLDFMLVHAGVHPSWDLNQVLAHSSELERTLRGAESQLFFEKMYGDKPDLWSADLSGIERLRCITNIFTRMRFLGPDYQINLDAKGAPDQHGESNLTPWYALPGRLGSNTSVVFGHWATLAVGAYGRHYAIDGGCIWGGRFTALQLDSAEPQWYSIDCQN
ncbi:MAG: bis(5'-nucleosyl)-tetraphosphatase (symmetrical) [Gammaproteobacteria bacterium]|jgi:bis(5'-nucleosyl)-tetraphosphatase (symmetrical)